MSWLCCLLCALGEDNLSCVHHLLKNIQALDSVGEKSVKIVLLVRRKQYGRVKWLGIISRAILYFALLNRVKVIASDGATFRNSKWRGQTLGL